MKTLYLLFLIAMLAFKTNNLFSQESNNNPLIDYKNQPEKLIDYDFKGSLSAEQNTALENEITQMQFVTNAKVILKLEKTSGIARVQVKEFYTNKNTDFEFDIYKLKMILVKYGLTPIEYRTQTISK